LVVVGVRKTGILGDIMIGESLRADVGEGLKRLGLPRLILEGYPSLGLLANLANRHENVTKVLFLAHAAELFFVSRVSDSVVGRAPSMPSSPPTTSSNNKRRRRF
jgi:hypothetical protein